MRSATTTHRTDVQTVAGRASLNAGSASGLRAFQRARNASADAGESVFRGAETYGDECCTILPSSCASPGCTGEPSRAERSGTGAEG